MNVSHHEFSVNNVDFELVRMISGNENLMGFFLEAGDGGLYKLELIFEERWYLKAFLSMPRLFW